MINLNEAFEEELYYDYLRDPESVSKQWREYFEAKSGSDANQPMNKPVITKSELSETKIEKKIELKLNAGETLEALPNISIKIAENMQKSLEIPTATSVRAIPVKALDENRRIINKHLAKVKRKKISFTHILGWAIVKGLVKYPNLNASFVKNDGIAYKVKKDGVNLGLAVDLTKRDGSRLLLVPNIKNADKLNFLEFIEQYDKLIDKARNNKLDLSDLEGTSVTLTNPGMIGTTHSIPRLMQGQGLIIASGSIDYPVEFQAVRPEMLTNLAVSKTVTLTSTYDHRIIQGAESAEFLNYVNKLLLGKERFYDQMFYSLNIPFEPIRWESDAPQSINSRDSKSDDIEKSAHVMQMINAFRVRGHLLAEINPLGRESYYYPELDPAYYGFTIWDLDRIFHADDSWDNNNMPLRDIIELLRETYCGHIGYEFMHIQDPVKKDFVKENLEKTRGSRNFSSQQKLMILNKLVEAEFFENFLHTKFVGSKRFSLEGGESLVVMIEALLKESSYADLKKVVIGMAHRGRINVLVNNVGKKPEQVFNEFEGVIEVEHFHGSGDVKYHLGDKGKYVNAAGDEIEVILSPNPSHLELVDPIIVGMARALDDAMNDEALTKSLPIIVHGDAAFAGQGIVAETLNLSQLEGYKTGGSIHIIINNQIGFTTTSDSSRSTLYATDIAKMIQAPILHVNGNDPEAVCNAAIFALHYRNQFGSDVIIDMLCFRKYGHNESDEPTYTQPLLYKKIKQMPAVSKVYTQELIRDGVTNEAEVKGFYDNLKQSLEKAFSERKAKPVKSEYTYYMKEGTTLSPIFTSVAKETIEFITKTITTVPEGFNPNPKIKGLLKKRADSIVSTTPAIDWAMGEALALGSILLEGRNIRFTGQDSRRGTFSQRHAVLTDIETENIYISLNHLKPDQGKLMIYDSPLSEVAVLGYEYGYSVIAENDLTLWEAQFGDFANNAQTIVDQYLSCAEVKWGQTSNLVMLLPHGYDGQGPEHSSARLERYLQSCAEDNMIVCNLSTPAQYYHVLRRQLYMTHRLPLIITTPKSMLRHPKAVSELRDFTHSEFKHIIDDDTQNPELINRAVLCSGKLYWDLLAAKEAGRHDNVALIRVEQLYPLHENLLKQILSRYENLVELVWAQEEPKNMGAWNFLSFKLFKASPDGVSVFYCGRRESAATATGSSKIHNIEQNEIITNAFSDIPGELII